MTLTTRQQAEILAGVILISFASGRYLTPVRVKIETKTVEVKVKDEDKKIHEKKHIVTINDGTTTTTTEDDDESDNDDTKVTDNKDTDKTKEVTKEDSHVNISAMAARDPSTGLLTYGAQVQKDILGPITGGVFGMMNGLVGISLGLRF